LELRLSRSFLFTGRVLDAVTRQPVLGFRLVRGYTWNSSMDAETNWQPGGERRATSVDGTFSLGLDYVSGGEVRFLAVADGYLAQASPAFPEAGWHEHEFLLEKGEGPRGVVLNGRGEPVEGAQVVMLGFGYVALQAGTFRSLGPSAENLATTDAQGRFSLPALVPEPRLVAVHAEEGFVEVGAGDGAESWRLTLQPWGRIEGVMKVGSALAADREVCLVNQSTSAAGLAFDFEAFKVRTDAEGRFVFGKAPPGWRQLMRPVPMGNRGWSLSHLVPVEVKAGEVTRVVYGGTGRPVIGRVVPDGADMKIEWVSGHHMLSTRFPQPPDEQRTPEGMRAWQNSDEFKEALANRRYYSPTWSEDGSFRFDDVEPGLYDLHFMFADSADGFGGVAVGSIMRAVEVGEIPGGQTDDPLDLGELPLAVRSAEAMEAERKRQASEQSARVHNVSSQSVPRLDGGVFDVSVMIDKHVLMTLWATTNAASRDELRMLKQIAAEYGGDDRLVMLGAIADDDVEA